MAQATGTHLAVAAVLVHRTVKVVRGGAEPPSGAVELVTPEGVRVRVVAEPAPRSAAEPLRSNTVNKSSAGQTQIGKARNEVGKVREEHVAKLVGGRVVREKLLAKGLGSVEVDVIGPAGELITVGGPAKVKNPSKWALHLQRLKAVGDARGVRVMAYLEEGTPEVAIRLAKKWLGAKNVVIFAGR